MRCDLHLHSTASGKCDTPGLSRVCKESYNQPAAVYDRCKHLGMTIVTLTDHNSIEGAEALRKHPDFFLSEEATVRMPSGTETHLGVYGITERDHAEIQRRRSDFISLLMYLTERKLFFSVNHVFSGLTGHRDEDDFHLVRLVRPRVGSAQRSDVGGANRAAERLARNLRKIPIAGSDSHTLAGAGLTYTQIPGARTVEEYLTGLRAGRGIVHGEHGRYLKLTADIFFFAGALLKEKPWCAPLVIAAVLIPAVTAAHWFNEIRFCKHGWQYWELREKAAHVMGHRRGIQGELGELKERHDHGENRLELHRESRPSRDASHEPVEGAPLDSILDVRATRMGDGWVWYGLAAIVLLVGGDSRYAAMGAAICAGLASVIVVQSNESDQPPTAALRTGTTLLGELFPRTNFRFPRVTPLQRFR